MPPKAGRKPRAYLLWGQEELRKREFLDNLLAELVPPEDRELDVQWIDATNAGVTGESILHAVRDRAMFSERRVVVVLHAGRFRGPRHQRTQDLLAAGIPSLPDYSTLILYAYAEESDERKSRSPFGEKLMAALKSAGEVKQFALLKPDELARIATAEAAAGGKKLAPAAASMLAARVAGDTRRLLQETRKLVVYVQDRPAISPQDVNTLVAAPPDDNVFHLLDAAMSGNRQQALQILRQLREGGSAAPQLLTLLGRTVRLVAQAKLLQEHRVPPRASKEDISPELLALLPEEASIYRSTSDWQRDKNLWPQAARISWPHLHRALDRLAVTDAGTKGWDYGVEDPDLALELFVIALCDTVGTGGSAPRGYAPSRRG